MSYHLSDNTYQQLHQVRDSIRLLKHSTQEAEHAATLYCAQISSFLALMDDQLTSVMTDATEESQGASDSARRTGG